MGGHWNEFHEYEGHRASPRPLGLPICIHSPWFYRQSGGHWECRSVNNLLVGKRSENTELERKGQTAVGLACSAAAPFRPPPPFLCFQLWAAGGSGIEEHLELKGKVTNGEGWKTVKTHGICSRLQLAGDACALDGQSTMAVQKTRGHWPYKPVAKKTVLNRNLFWLGGQIQSFGCKISCLRHFLRHWTNLEQEPLTCMALSQVIIWARHHLLFSS